MHIHIYEGLRGKLTTTVLRPGKRPTGKQIASVLNWIIKRIRQAWPEGGILSRERIAAENLVFLLWSRMDKFLERVNKGEELI